MTIERAKIKLQKLELENEMLKQLLQYGKIYVNYNSSDCDGGHSGGHRTFNSIYEVYEWWENEAESADGPFGWALTIPEELEENYTYFTR
jgi:hypothetical protein